MIFLDEIFFWKNSVDFWHRKLSLKVRFWHFLTNRNSSKDFFKANFFEYVHSWPKSLLLRTHHLWNSMTELILVYSYFLKIGFARVKCRDILLLCCCNVFVLFSTDHKLTKTLLKITYVWKRLLPMNTCCNIFVVQSRGKGWK